MVGEVFVLYCTRLQKAAMDLWLEMPLEQLYRTVPGPEVPPKTLSQHHAQMQ